MKKASGGVTAAVVLMFDAAFLVATGIGLSTTSDDAAALGERLPKWFVWLSGTPWWVAVILSLLPLAYVVWAFWPDKRIHEAYEAALLSYRASNERAWDHSGEFRAYRDTTEDKLGKALEQLERIEVQHAEYAAITSDLQAKLDAVLLRNEVDWQPAFQKIHDDMKQGLNRFFVMREQEITKSFLSMQKQLLYGYNPNQDVTPVSPPPPGTVEETQP